jgi:hypothetical protein
MPTYLCAAKASTPSSFLFLMSTATTHASASQRLIFGCEIDDISIFLQAEHGLACVEFPEG